MAIFIRANAVQDCQGGYFRIELQERPLTPEQMEILRTLFPNTMDRAEYLLEQEALLRAIVSDTEADQHMARGADPMPVKKYPKIGKPLGKLPSPDFPED